jgi:hypothetical protein
MPKASMEWEFRLKTSSTFTGSRYVAN